MKGNCIRVVIRMMQIVRMKGNFLINHPPQSSMIGLNKLLVEFGRSNDCTASVASNSLSQSLTAISNLSRGPNFQLELVRPNFQLYRIGHCPH